MRSGDTPSGVFYLARGYVRLYSLSQNGEELTLIIFKPGDLFPLMWAINATPNDYYLEGMTDSLLWRVKREKFLEFIKENPDISYGLTSRILVRLGGFLVRMEHLVFGDAYAKVASILLICAERFGKRIGRETIIQVPLTHSNVASLVGVTRETASIELKKIEKKSLIAYRGRLLVIKNLKGLQRESLLEV